ncbi:hypothetical protein BCR37DRAFT_384217, partial [Protomyces lactucae-debilis]
MMMCSRALLIIVKTFRSVVFHLRPTLSGTFFLSIVVWNWESLEECEFQRIGPQNIWFAGRCLPVMCIVCAIVARFCSTMDIISKCIVSASDVGPVSSMTGTLIRFRLALLGAYTTSINASHQQRAQWQNAQSEVGAYTTSRNGSHQRRAQWQNAQTRTQPKN